MCIQIDIDFLYSFLVYLNIHDCNHKEFFIFGKWYKIYDKLQSHFVRKRILHYIKIMLICIAILYSTHLCENVLRFVHLFIWIYSKNYSRVITSYTINANERFGRSILIWTNKGWTQKPYMEVEQVKKIVRRNIHCRCRNTLLQCPRVILGIVTTHFEKLRTSTNFVR